MALPAATFDPQPRQWLDVRLFGEWVEAFSLQWDAISPLTFLVHSVALSSPCVRSLPADSIAPFRSQTHRSSLRSNLRQVLSEQAISLKPELLTRLDAIGGTDDELVQLFAGFFPAVCVSASDHSICEEHLAKECLLEFYELLRDACEQGRTAWVVRVWQSVWKTEKLFFSGRSQCEAEAVRPVLMAHVRAVSHPECPLFVLKSFKKVREFCCVHGKGEKFRVEMEAQDGGLDYFARALVAYSGYLVRVLDYRGALEAALQLLQCCNSLKAPEIREAIPSILINCNQYLRICSENNQRIKAEIIAILLTAPFPFGRVSVSDLWKFSLLDTISFDFFCRFAQRPAIVSLLELLAAQRAPPALSSLYITSNDRAISLLIQCVSTPQVPQDLLIRLCFLVKRFSVVVVFEGRDFVREYRGKIRRVAMWVKERGARWGRVPKGVMEDVGRSFL